MITETEKGSIQEFTIGVPQTNTEKHIWVYLPAGYIDYQKQYPVIYMHDGQNVFDKIDNPKHQWHIEEKLNELHSQAIVIGIAHGLQRVDEMTPYASETHGGGHADNYLDFIVNTLKPYVDDNYRTLTNAENTTVFGCSLGGLTSFYAVLKYPEVFGNAGVFSPSFWFSEEIYAFAKSIDSVTSRFYFMAGDRESNAMLPDLEKMLHILLQKVQHPLQLQKKIVHNGQHNEKLWRKEFADAYKWLMRV